MKPSRSKAWPFVLAVLAVIIAVGAYLGLRGKFGSEASDQRLKKVVRTNLVQRVTIAGSVEPVRTTTIGAPYDGYIKNLYVQLGDSIKSGQPAVSVAQSLHANESVFPIRSPFTGTVTQVLKSEGQFVKTGDAKDFILRIDDLSKMYVRANAPENDILKVKTGLEAVIKASAVLEKSYSGVVTEISRAATIKDQWGSRSQVDYQVKIEVKNADAQLLPGMSAVVDLITQKKENVLTLPHEFIQEENEAHFVIMKDGSRRDIKIGAQNEIETEIVSGLKEGEEVRQVDFLELVEMKK